MNEEVLKKLEEEANKIKLWAENVQRRLVREHGAASFSVEFLDSNCFSELFTLCNFEVTSTLPSKVIKDAIRMEAEPFKDGRLYFHVYNAATKRIHLIFYSFFILRRVHDLD